jgi:ABC-type Na+ efflux pump permease subunit
LGLLLGVMFGSLLGLFAAAEPLIMAAIVSVLIVLSGDNALSIILVLAPVLHSFVFLLKEFLFSPPEPPKKTASQSGHFRSLSSAGRPLSPPSLVCRHPTPAPPPSPSP